MPWSFDLAVEQPQLFRKLSKNKNKTSNESRANNELAPRVVQTGTIEERKVTARKLGNALDIKNTLAIGNAWDIKNTLAIGTAGRNQHSTNNNKRKKLQIKLYMKL